MPAGLSRWREQTLLGVWLLLCCAFSTTDQKTERRIRTTQALDAYEAGQWDTAVTLAAAETRFDDLLQEYPGVSSAWARSGRDSSNQARRESEADVLALELGNVSLRDRAQWEAGRTLVLLTIDRVSHGRPTPFEHAWSRALIALMDAQPETSKKWAQILVWLQGRFADDGRFGLATVTNRVEARLLTGHPADTPRLIGTRDDLDLTLSDLAALEARPDVRAEAALRRGVVQFETGDLQDALVDLAVAGDPANHGDAFTRYLAHLVAARALEAGKREARALQEYDRAVEVMPDAQSAAIARALATMDTTRRLETAEDLDRVLRRTPVVPDPWHEYTFGEYHRWSEAIAALRALVAQ